MYVVFGDEVLDSNEVIDLFNNESIFCGNRFNKIY